MRYPRNVKIFRGGVDAAPFAGLFFSTILFMVLFYSHVFFPGVPVALADEEEGAELTDRTVEVLKDRKVRFLGEVYDLPTFQQELAARVKRGDLPKRVILESEAGAPGEVVTAVANMLNDAGTRIKLPRSRLELPDDAGFAGTPNPVVVVGVNLNGQIFFQHQKIQEAALEMRLTEAVERTDGPLRMVLQADKNLPLEKVTQLSKIARKAGIAEVVIGTRPPIL
ncbi:MAG: biopolymer transporter ExbD [Limisphaerales bacterium]